MKNRWYMTASEKKMEGALRRSQALSFIGAYTTAMGYPPNRREIAEAVGLRSPSDAQRLVDEMVEEGLLEVTPGVARGVRVITGSNMKHGETHL